VQRQKINNQVEASAIIGLFQQPCGIGILAGLPVTGIRRYKVTHKWGYDQWLISTT
jgi:hypothetical protein